MTTQKPETETCLNCRHEEKAHRNGTNHLNDGLVRECYLCRCKKFIPQNQSQSKSLKENAIDKTDKTPSGVSKNNSGGVQTPPTKPNEDGSKYTEYSVGKADKTAENFNLSEKICYISQDNGHYHVCDVKEFIRRVLNDLHYTLVEKEDFISLSEKAFNRDVKEIIRRNAGEDLLK